MAWPFDSVAAFNLDSGMENIPGTIAAVPDVPSVSTPVWLAGVLVYNPTNDAINFTLTQGDDAVIFGPVSIPGGGFLTPPDLPAMPSVGLKWVASSVGLIGRVWGWH